MTIEGRWDAVAWTLWERRSVVEGSLLRGHLAAISSFTGGHRTAVELACEWPRSPLEGHSIGRAGPSRGHRVAIEWRLRGHTRARAR
eukprot:6375342-Lingulodinium_polyedra.AAC.1